MQPVKQIRFVKLKQWYIPADEESYKVLHRLKVPNVRFNEDFIDTLQLLTRKHRISAVSVPFASVMDDFMSQFIAMWEKNPQRRIFLSKGTIRLESKDLRNVKKTFPEAESCLRRFFRRWGFDCESQFSESPTRAKLLITFQLSKTKHPVIPFLKG